MTPRHNNPLHHQHFDRSRQHFRVLCIYLLTALTVTATTSSLLQPLPAHFFNRRLKRAENNSDKQRGVGHESTIFLRRASGDCTTTVGKNHTKLLAIDTHVLHAAKAPCTKRTTIAN
ncbi:unnamed protein product, partial [Ectocarpus sp. 12 AP-2014]